MKRTIVASVVGALLAVGAVAAPASAGSGSTSDSDGERSVRMKVSTPKYVTINRDGATKVPVEARLTFGGAGELTGWWTEPGFPTTSGFVMAMGLKDDWTFAYNEFSRKVSPTKKTTITFPRSTYLDPQRLAVGAGVAPVYGGTELFPYGEHLTTVYLRNQRKIVGTDAYRVKGSRAYVQVRGTVKDNVWASASSSADTWKGRKGVRVAVQFDPRGPGGWRTVKHVTTGKDGKVVTRIKRAKAGKVRLVVTGTNRTTPARGADGVAAR